MEGNSKICYKCGEDQPLADFPRDKKSKDGFRSTCKNCHRQVCKSYRVEIKKQKEPMETLQMKIRKLALEIANADDETDLIEQAAKLNQLVIEKSTQPRNKFDIDTVPLGERSSMADTIVMSRLPLFINENLHKIINPSLIKIEFKADQNKVFVELPEDVKLTRQQIENFRLSI
jgi:hypothetical protein